MTLGCSAIVHKLHWRPSSIILDKVTLGQTWSWRWHWRLPSSSGYWMTFRVAAHLYLGKSVTEHGTYLSTPLHRLWTIQKSSAVSCRRSVHIFQLNLSMGRKLSWIRTRMFSAQEGSDNKEYSIKTKPQGYEARDLSSIFTLFLASILIHSFIYA